MTNEIVRHVDLPAAPNVVWENSFATPEALSSWFPEKIEGEFAVGAEGFFVWGEHRSQVRVVEYEPGRSIAFQWHPGDAYLLTDHPESELTTFRFELSATSTGTRVTMVESGFANINPDRSDWAFGQNNGGWDEELPKLAKQYSS